MRLAVLLWASSWVTAQVTVPMSQYDAERTNANLQEGILRPSNVNPTQFGKLFSRTVDDSVYAEPLILANLNLGDGPRNILIVATMNNTVYAFDADRPEHKKPYWSRALGMPAPGNWYIGPDRFGILSTPCFDASTGTIYAVSKNSTAGEISTWVHALDVFTGKPKFNSPQKLSYPFRDGTTVTDVPDAIQRAGLLVTNSTLVIATASILPGDQQEGFVQSFDASDLSHRLASFQVTPTGLKGGIWQAGRGVAADGHGNVYVVTAGGDYDGKIDFGSTFLKLDAKTLAVADWFTPANHEYLFHANMDPSAGGVTLIPGTTLLFGGGKDGIVNLMDREKMGHLETPGVPLQRLQAAAGCGPQKPCAEAAQSLGTAFWNRGAEGLLYVWDRNDALRAYRFVNQRFETTPAAVNSTAHVVTGGPTLSADGAALETGIVWAATASSEPRGPVVDGVLRAYLASDVSKQLYSSDANPKRDTPGAFTKFATPVVANGKVYVPTQSNRISVYGLLRAPK